jgi:hypothetical protein
MTATPAAISTVRARVLSETALFVATFIGFVVWEFGGHIDVWYHQHYGFAIESFVTWPHALLYAGWIASAVPAAVYVFDSRRLGVARSAMLPAGYALVLVAAAAFGAAGIFDLAWHATVGFEVNQEALVSPSHIALIFSSGLGYIGLAWVAIARRGRVPGQRLLMDLAIALSVGAVLRHSLYALSYSQPFSADYASAGAIAGKLFGFNGVTAWLDETAQVAGVSGVILYSMLLSLFLVVPLRRLRLASGAIAMIVLWNAVFSLVGIPEMWIYLPAIVGSAVVGELLWAAMGRGALGGRDERRGYWVIGFAVPATQFFLYFAIMAAYGGGIVWSTPLWTGTPILAGLYGLLASGLAIPPRFLSAATQRSEN